VYYDPIDGTVLALEQIDNEMCSWRSGAKVEKKLLKQWFIGTTQFVQQLSEGLNSPDLKSGWRDIVALQKHWIGELCGCFIDCNLEFSNDELKQSSSELRDLLKESTRLWFSSPLALESATCVILSPNHVLSSKPELVHCSHSNELKQLKFKIKNPVTGKLIPVFTGNENTMPKIPESADCRVNEHLTEEKCADLASNEEFLTEINKVS